jgi:hypothetical protein
MEVPVAAPPDAGLGVPRLASGSPVSREALEVAFEHEDIRPPGTQHRLAYIQAIGAIDVEQRAPEAIDGVPGGIADERDLLTLGELPHRLRRVFSAALNRDARLQGLRRVDAEAKHC